MADSGSGRRYRRRFAAGGILLVVAIGVVRAGAAELPAVFAGDATSSGARLSFFVPGQFAVEEIIDGGGPLARSHLDSVGGASDAAFPYPGGTALAYQGFVALTGITSPFAYPAYVQATNPGTASQETGDPTGAYHLAATAEVGRTTGLAQLQGGSADSILSGVSASTSVARDTEVVTAKAENLARGLQVGKDLTISSVRSRSVTTFKRDATGPVSETELVVEGLQIAGHKFGVTPQGFVALGQPVPTPASAVKEQIAALLKPSGLSLQFVGSTVGGGTAEAAALEISGTSPAAPTFPTGKFTLRLGGARSAVRTGEGATGLPTLPPIAKGSVPAPSGLLTSPAAEPAPAPEPSASAQLATAPIGGGGFGLSPTSSSFTTTAQITGAEPGQVAAAPTPTGSPPLAMQPILRPKRVGSVDWLVTVILAAGAALVLLAGFSKRSGETQPWAG